MTRQTVHEQEKLIEDENRNALDWGLPDDGVFRDPEDLFGMNETEHAAWIALTKNFPHNTGKADWNLGHDCLLAAFKHNSLVWRPLKTKVLDPVKDDSDQSSSDNHRASSMGSDTKGHLVKNDPEPWTYAKDLQKRTEADANARGDGQMACEHTEKASWKFLKEVWPETCPKTWALFKKDARFRCKFFPDKRIISKLSENL